MSKEKYSVQAETMIEELEKLFGKGTVLLGIEKEPYGDIIPSSSFSFNYASGIGGVAKKKIYDIYADPSAGKSTLGYDLIGNCQKKFGEWALLIDKEDSYSPNYGAAMGIDNEKLIVMNNKSSKIESLEDMYDVLRKAIESNKFGIIVVDSVTSFAPQSKFEDSAVMGVEARVNSDKMRLINNLMPKSNTCLLLLRQSRQSIGGFGNPITVSGGTAIPFYSHVRVWVTRSEIDRELGKNKIKFNFVKNKMSVPFKIGVTLYDWKEGFDSASECGDLALEFGIISISGKKYTLPNIDESITGKKKVVEFLKQNPDYVTTILQPLVESKLNNSEEIVEEPDVQ
jgi:protein RecA